MNESSESKTPISDALQAACHAMPLRVRAIDHACAEHRKLELEIIELKRQLKEANEYIQVTKEDPTA